MLDALRVENFPAFVFMYSGRILLSGCCEVTFRFIVAFSLASVIGSGTRPGFPRLALLAFGMLIFLASQPLFGLGATT
jgi:hypothetical protein